MRDALGAVQSVLVLGGGSEIAAATVERLARDRCRTVVLAGRDPERLAPVAERARAAGATTVEVVAFDASRPETHAAVVDQVFAEHPDLDVVLLAFGVLGDQEVFDEDPAAAAAAATTNYVGAVSSGLAVAGHLRRQGHGTLVVLSSVAGERVRAENFVYGSTKAGLDAFAQGLGDALAGSGASVMVVRPGFVRTAMTAHLDDGPMATTAEAVADDIADGLRRGAHTVWSPAKLRPVFSVLRHLPRPVWRKVAAAKGSSR
jgi:decaprenylphospho-beta-D-erythro-pentofuranosid-2-ulose 2-reductase